jgi:alpha-galactosidase
MAAPLMAGNDIRNSSSATLAILNNADLIAVNQDSLALQAGQVSHDGTRRVLAKRLANGDVAVALFNQGSSSTTISTTAAAIGKSGSSFTVRDLWTGATSTSTGTISATVPGHGTAVFRISGGGNTTTTTTTTTGSTFRLRGEASGRCLDVNGGSSANGSQMLIWDCHTGTNQRFTQNGQALQVLGKCLDVPLNATNGARAQLWDCNGGANQRWTMNSNGTISSAQSGLCLDVNAGATANGTAVIVWSCHGGANQRWGRA